MREISIRIVLLLSTVILIVIGFKSCVDEPRIELTDDTIKGIAYDVNEEYGYTVYIQEGGKYVPYLVLTGDFNGDGNVLLLRKYLMDEMRQSNTYSSYYKDSLIDTYLNGEFLELLEPDMQESIVTSTIIITAEYLLWTSNGVEGIDTEEINRKVFLLSHTELGYEDVSIVDKAGEPLKYFSNRENQKAYKAGESEPTTWRTRSTYRGQGDFLVVTIGPEGQWGGSTASRENHIRPAFCVNGDMGIEKTGGIIKGEEVYKFMTSS